MRSAFFAGLLVCVLLSSCSHKEEPSRRTDSLMVLDTLPRSTITFILGEDENPRNPYYSLADKYYRLSDSEKSEIVIDTIFSLSGVLEYLAQNPPRNGRPWGLINLVSHGNEFIDLSATVIPYGARISSDAIERAIHDSLLKPLSPSIADGRTLVNLHGCAVGKNTDLLRMLGIAFGGSSPVPVKASKMFEYYGNVAHNENPRYINHYYARAWYQFFHPDSVPSDSDLAARFLAQNPTADVNWQAALDRYHPDNPSQEYNMRMYIPVVWQDFYASRQAMPDLRAQERRDAWLQEHPGFDSLISRTAIPRENFQVKFFNATFDADTGKVYAIRVKARAGVACVIKPVLSNDTSLHKAYAPYIPASNDSDFFGFAK